MQCHFRHRSTQHHQLQGHHHREPPARPAATRRGERMCARSAFNVRFRVFAEQFRVDMSGLLVEPGLQWHLQVRRLPHGFGALAGLDHLALAWSDLACLLVEGKTLTMIRELPRYKPTAAVRELKIPPGASDVADAGPKGLVHVVPHEALVGAPHAEAAATPPSLLLLVCEMPALPVWRTVWPLCAGGLATGLQTHRLGPLWVGTGRAKVGQAKLRLDVPDAEGALWQQPCVLVDVPKTPQEPRKRPAAQALAHGAEGAQVHLLWPGVAHVWVVTELLSEVVEPAHGSPCPVPQHGHDVHVVPLLRPLVLRTAPHVSDKSVLQSDDFAPAEPSAQGLVDVLPAPAEHLVIKAAALVPPPLRHGRQAAGEHRHVHVVGASPLEVPVPRDIALGHAAALSLLLPSVDVQRSDLRHNHAAVVLADERQEVLVPVPLGGHMAVEETHNVPDGRVAARLLGPDEAHGLLVAENTDLVSPLDLRPQVSAGERRVAAVVHDDDLAEDVGGRSLVEGLHGLQGELPLLSARQDYRDGPRRPPELFRQRVELEAVGSRKRVRPSRRWLGRRRGKRGAEGADSSGRYAGNAVGSEVHGH
mmetsp:Transcript_4746/g.14433  ORF Transcript_4746/g.14433 Transcript_4746/m.14433 type:complete len:589 (+) Transcript_4746:384-2150(+)